MDRDVAFGRLLHRLRRARGLTQAALAQQAYCAIDTIKKIESGARRPSQQMAEQFADCLALLGDERAAFLAAARAAADHEPDASAAARHTKLPHPPTALLGRTAELLALAALFANPTTRLITITGPGGMGKTRLAIALAEQLHTAERFHDGVYFVALAALEAAERIIHALAATLGIALDAGKQARSLQQQVFDYLRTKRLLLVFDNVEHLLGDAAAGAENAADLVAALLESAPGVAILATSRERLRLREEHLYPLGGLHVPSVNAASDASALALFVQRAQLLRPDFTPTHADQASIARICRLIDGMPLAIELAAGWIDTLAAADIALALERDLDVLTTELRDVPARHRSMRAVFDGSYQRLKTSEQAVFAQLAVFRGGGSLEALQMILQATLAQLQVLIGASLLSYDAGSLHDPRAAAAICGRKAQRELRRAGACARAACRILLHIRPAAGCQAVWLRSAGGVGGA